MSNLVNELDKEIAELELKLTKAREFRAAYANPMSPMEKLVTQAVEMRKPPRGQKPGAWVEHRQAVKESRIVAASAKAHAPRGKKVDKARIVNDVKAFLTGSNEPYLTSKIVNLLARRNDFITTTKLSSILSTSPQFKAHGRKGWTLVEEPKSSEEPVQDLQPEDQAEAAE